MPYKKSLEEYYHDMLSFYNSITTIQVGSNVYVHKFIRFISSSQADEEISKVLIDKWIMSLKVSINTRNSTIGAIRRFTRYLNFIGEKAYIPDKSYTSKAVHYSPYILNDDELSKLFNAIDELKDNHISYNRELVAPVIFRMIYCCGLRPQEARHLKLTDINLETGEIYIRKSKNGKDRHIIMHDDLRVLCNVYHNQIHKPNRTYLFEYYDGNEYTEAWVRDNFRKALIKAGLPLKGIRPYDLRHCFATNNLIDWMNNGVDYIKMMPYLSEYMGHRSFKYTFYYIHLVTDSLRKSGIIESELGIYPQVSDDEDN